MMNAPENNSSERNNELIELRDSAREVLDGLGLAASEEKSWSTLLELGWLLVAVPESLGGLQQGIAGACAFHTEMGRGLASAPYAAAMLAVDALCHSKIADQQQWIERFTTRDLVTTPMAETSARVNVDKLSGTATAVPSADKATHVLVCEDDGQRVVLVALDQPGVERIARPTWDETRRLFDLRFTDVPLDDALTLATGDAAKTLSTRIATLRDFALAADAVGGAQVLLERTVDYLQTRRQFGRPLALFQALKHRCADLKALTAGAEALLLDSLSRLGEEIERPQASVMGKAAKYLACSVYAQVAEESVQLHGGIGVTSEHPCHLFLKRALLNEHLGRLSGSYEFDIADGLLNRAV